MNEQHQAKAREIVDHLEQREVPFSDGEPLIKFPHEGGREETIAAIADALDEETEMCAKIADANWQDQTVLGDKMAQGVVSAGERIAFNIRSRLKEDNDG